MNDQNALEKPTVINAPVDKIKPSPVNKRSWPKKNTGLQELADSIGSQGLIQPVLVRVDPKDKNGYELVAGERRLRAFKLLKFKVIPSIVRTLTDQEAYSITATENLQREDLTPLEEAQSVQVLIDSKHETKDIADRLGKTIQWVRRRAKLTDLAPCWLKAIENPKNEFSQWGVMHLELIARYEQKKQKHIYSRISSEWNYGKMPLSELKKLLQAEMFNLSSAPWKITDETVISSGGACSVCSSRSSCEPDLFEIEVTKKGIEKDFCLDTACWGKKLIAFNKKKITSLKEENAGLVLFGGGQGRDMLPDGHPWEHNTQSSYNFTDCKKSDKNAMPAYIIDGAGVGTVKYVKRYGGTSSSGRMPAGTPKPMKERKAALLKQRVIRYITKILQLLDGVEPCQPVKGTDGEMQEPGKLNTEEWKVPGQTLTHFELFALISQFGSSSNTNWDDYDTTPFARYKKVLESTEIEAAKITYGEIVYKISDELRTESNTTTPDKEFPVKVCKALYLDSKRLWKMVLDEIKEPKIWETLNDDGTNKEKATPKKKKSS